MFFIFRLEVGLAKKEDEMLMWPEVVVGDQMGEYFVDPDQARIIHDRLAHLTSDELVGFIAASSLYMFHLTLSSIHTNVALHILIMILA